jgi:hypothetical protein
MEQSHSREKLADPQLGKKFLAFYGTHRSIIHILTQINLVHIFQSFIPTIYIKINLPRTPSSVYLFLSSGFSTKTPCAFLF